MCMHKYACKNFMESHYKEIGKSLLKKFTMVRKYTNICKAIALAPPLLMSQEQLVSCFILSIIGKIFKKCFELPQ